MTRCKGIAKNGNRCRASASINGYCRWHSNVQECAVCYEPFANGDTALPCSHWIHRECVQKSADALQEIRASEGYPPIQDCTCPVCRAVVPDMKPKEAPPVPSLESGIILTSTEMTAVFQEWRDDGSTYPLRLYIWNKLVEKYPEHHVQELVSIAGAFEEIIRMVMIYQTPQLDSRFAEVLNRAWRYSL